MSASNFNQPEIRSAKYSVRGRIININRSEEKANSTNLSQTPSQNGTRHHHSRGGYFIAAYVIDPDVWYILPLAATNRQPQILLSPHRKRSKYARYKEAWPLLMSEAAPKG